MLVLILPSGHQTFCSRDGACNICRDPESVVRRIGRNEIVVEDRESGSVCRLVTAPFGGYDLRQFAKERGIRVNA